MATKSAPVALVLPTFSLKNPAEWQRLIRLNGNDDYGRPILHFAAHWAHTMERKMLSGASLTDIVDDAREEANKRVPGMSLCGANFAISALVDVWVRGEQLRQWHNLTVGGEQGARANLDGHLLDSSVLVVRS